MGDIIMAGAIILACLVIGSALMVVAFTCCKIANRKHDKEVSGNKNK